MTIGGSSSSIKPVASSGLKLGASPAAATTASSDWDDWGVGGAGKQPASSSLSKGSSSSSIKPVASSGLKLGASPAAAAAASSDWDDWGGKQPSAAAASSSSSSLSSSAKKDDWDDWGVSGSSNGSSSGSKPVAKKLGLGVGAVKKSAVKQDLMSFEDD